MDHSPHYVATYSIGCQFIHSNLFFLTSNLNLHLCSFNSMLLFLVCPLGQWRITLLPQVYCLSHSRSFWIFFFISKILFSYMPPENWISVISVTSLKSCMKTVSNTESIGSAANWYFFARWNGAINKHHWGESFNQFWVHLTIVSFSWRVSSWASHSLSPTTS